MDTTTVPSLKDISAQYCEVCKHMLQDSLELQQSGSWYLERDHHRTARDLRMAAAACCGLCIQIEEAFRRKGLPFRCYETPIGRGLTNCQL